MPLKAILFDAFGTVIHPEPGWEALREECLAVVHGTWTGPAVPFARWLPAYEKARSEQHALVAEGFREFDFPERFTRSMILCNAPPKDAEAWGPVGAEKYHRFQQGLIHAYDEPGPTLRALKDAGYKVALVSNYAHTGVLEDSLSRLGIRQHFDALIVSGDVGYVKPHRRIFEAAVERLGVSMGEAVMVGNDIECDITGAKRAGLATIWAPYPREVPAPAHPDADAVVERLSDIPRILPRFG